MKKLKLNLFMAAALAIAAVTMSFKMVADPTTYHYVSNSTAAGAFATVSNWAEGEGDCGPTGNKPCDIEVPDGSSLSAELAGKNNAQVLAINPSSRRN
ncbi:MAG: hypothetical protein KIT80_14990 [Chitinophagaceae bacterium]|nr:hypothetical protein [Chitinophagaceae bacterium]MCW5928219.1 hypothetical protein [Chitinophagaceae bacterium]